MEKTIEELKAELDAVRKNNIEAELKAEKEKESRRINDIHLQEEQRKKQDYEDEFKKKYGLTAKSRLEDTDRKPVNMTSGRTFEEFKDTVISHYKKRGLELTGKPYSQMVEEIQCGRVM